MRRLVTGLFLGCSLFASTVARAGPPEAQRLFTEGRTAMTKNDYETACAKFEESLKLEEAPGTVLNLGDCEEKRGHLVAAEVHYRRAASGFTNPQKQQFATEQADRVAQRVPKLLVHASAPGVVVHEGANEVALETPIKHDAGEITLRAEAPGRKPKELKATLTEKNQTTVDVGELEPETSELATTTPKEKTGSEGMSTLSMTGIIVGAVGVASLTTGAITGVMALGRASTVKDHCDDALACDSQGVDAASSGSTLSTISTITVIAGAALAVGGGAMFVIGRKKKSESAPAAATSILPSASPTFAGVLIGHRF